MLSESRKSNASSVKKETIYFSPSCFLFFSGASVNVSLRLHKHFHGPLPLASPLTPMLHACTLRLFLPSLFMQERMPPPPLFPPLRYPLGLAAFSPPPPPFLGGLHQEFLTMAISERKCERGGGKRKREREGPFSLLLATSRGIHKNGFGEEKDKRQLNSKEEERKSKHSSPSFGPAGASSNIVYFQAKERWGNICGILRCM